MQYQCLSFGWYHESLGEAQVMGLAAAETALTRMLDEGAMIVHAYGAANPDAPELVGRHSRLQAFMQVAGRERPSHEVERFLLDPAAAEAWQQAADTHRPLEERWSVTDFWPASGETESVVPYGKAMLIRALCPASTSSPSQKISRS